MTDLEDRLHRALSAIAADIDEPADLDATLAAITAELPEPVDVRRRRRRPVWLVAAAITVVGLGAVWTLAYRTGRTPDPVSDGRRLAGPVTKTIDGYGSITAKVETDGSMCWTAPSNGAAAYGCVDRATYESGRWWTTVSSSVGTILLGIGPVDRAVHVEIGGHTITADGDGFWWTVLTDSDTTFVITTTAGSHDEQLTATKTSPTPSPATSSPPPNTVVPASTTTAPSSPATGAVAPTADALPDGFVPTAAFRYEAPATDPGSASLRTVIARYSTDRTTVESEISFDVWPALSDAVFAEQFGEPNDTGEVVNGAPLLAVPSGFVWREPSRTVSVARTPDPPSAAGLAALAASTTTREDGAVEMIAPPDGWTVVESGVPTSGPSGTSWQIIYNGSESTDADFPELYIRRFANAGEPAEASLTMLGSHAVEVGGQRMIVIDLPSLRRTVNVVWDTSDGGRTEVSYRPINDVNPIDELEQTALRVAAGLRPVSEAEWAAFFDETAANAARRTTDAWLPGLLAANGLTQRGEPSVESMPALYLVPVTRADGTDTTCEITRRRLIACHDVDTVDGAELVDAQTVRVATTDPGVQHVSVVYPDQDRIGIGLTWSDDGVGLGVVIIDPARPAPDCVELIGSKNHLLRTIPISPATACTLNG